MHIGIDARMYGPRQGGLGRYIEQLIKYLEIIDVQNRYTIFLRKENFNDYIPVAPNFSKAPADIPWYGFAEQFRLPRILKYYKPDLMHFPHWNVPLLYNDPFVVTIHDLLLLHCPTREASTLGPVSYWFKNKSFRYVLKHAATRARHIMAPSEFTRQDIHQTLGVPLEKITVTYLAPSTPVTSINTGDRQATSCKLQAQYRVTKPYVLYVGVAFPHKNLDRLLRAWKLFEEQHGDAFQLVLAGPKNYFYNQLLNSATRKQCKNVVYVDSPDDQTLASLYAHASLFVFPSLYEGFGIPPLEAMQHGVPVIASNNTCLPEILQDAAFYFDPASEAEITKALERGFTDESVRYTLRINSEKVLKSYSWQTTARQTLTLYNSLAKT